MKKVRPYLLGTAIGILSIIIVVVVFYWPNLLSSVFSDYLPHSLPIKNASAMISSGPDFQPALFPLSF
jgi:hypothetical protein